MRRGVILPIIAALGACAPMAARPPAMTATAAPRAIEAAMMRDISVLASDDFEGRKPGTAGEAKTLKFLQREWQAAGLESGTNDPANSWFAPVELLQSIPDRSSVRFARGRQPIVLPPGSVEIYSAGARALIDQAPVLFAGEAGERLEGSQLAGRVVLMLWDHPGQAEQREALIRGGAAAVLAIVNDEAEMAAVVSQRKRGNYRLATADTNNAIDGLMTRATAARLIGAQQLGNLTAQAAEPGFRPVPLDLTASLEATASPGTVRTYNLIGRLPGRRSGAGAVLVMAHWDHFGRCANPPAEHLICNGAVDNASGLALLNELARRLGAGPRLDRDVYFLATTSEEWGLLGAQAFAENPPIPLDTIVAAFNVDSIAVAPRGTPVSIIGKGLTALDPGIATVMRQLGRKEADPTLGKAFLRRQDGWALLQRDVPAVSVTSAFGDPAALDAFMSQRYHLPADQVAGIELGGAADDLVLTQALVRHFANVQAWPSRAGKSAPAP